MENSSAHKICQSSLRREEGDKESKIQKSSEVKRSHFSNKDQNTSSINKQLDLEPFSQEPFCQNCLQAQSLKHLCKVNPKSAFIPHMAIQSQNTIEKTASDAVAAPAVNKPIRKRNVALSNQFVTGYPPPSNKTKTCSADVVVQTCNASPAPRCYGDKELLKKQWFQRTAEALLKSNMLQVTLRTAELLKQNQQLQKDIEMLKIDVAHFLQSVLTNVEGRNLCSRKDVNKE